MRLVFQSLQVVAVLQLVLFRCVVSQVPSNDRCIDAIPLEEDVEVMGDTTNANFDFTMQTICGPGSNRLAVWYQIFGIGKEIQVSLCNTNRMITDFGIFSNCITNNNDNNIDEDVCLGFSEPQEEPSACAAGDAVTYTFLAEAGESYLIHVRSFVDENGVGSQFKIHYTAAEESEDGDGDGEDNNIPLSFSECDAVDEELRACTEAVLSGMIMDDPNIRPCRSEFEIASQCHLKVLNSLESVEDIDDCQRFYDAWLPFCEIDGCQDCSEPGLSCDNAPYNCGRECSEASTTGRASSCVAAALDLNKCMKSRKDDQDEFLGACDMHNDDNDGDGDGSNDGDDGVDGSNDRDDGDGYGSNDGDDGDGDGSNDGDDGDGDGSNDRDDGDGDASNDGDDGDGDASNDGDDGDGSNDGEDPPLSFADCEATDAALQECTDSLLSGADIDCSGAFRTARNCNLRVLESLEYVSSIEDCRGFYNAFKPFCTIENCENCSGDEEDDLSCEHGPYSCGRACENDGSCPAAAVAAADLNKCLRDGLRGDAGRGDVLGACVIEHQELGPSDRPSNKCNRMRNETECNAVPEAGCFWCGDDTTDRGVCRASERLCPNRGTTARVCRAITNETDCRDDIDQDHRCFWCQDAGVCSNSEQECPGQGRGNPCRELLGEECESSAACLWCPDHAMCAAKRGNRECPQRGEGNSTNPVDNACRRLTNQDNCTESLACRWCGDDSVCQPFSAACSDGSAGIRGNPCERAESEDSCPTGCIWCLAKSKCQKSSDFVACLDDDIGQDNRNSCNVQDSAPDCNAEDGCQWCEQQSRCKLGQASCGDRRGDVGLDLEGTGGMFGIQDDGLGRADPNAVFVALDYLFEVAEDGSTVYESLIDFEFQDFEVKQTVGRFFGESNNIMARKITFEGIIDGAGSIEMDAFVMLQDGTIITEAGESWSVARGDVKFNVRLKNWSFCDAVANSCGGTDATSEFLDVAIKIQGRKQVPEPSNRDSLVFRLGGNVPLQLSNQVEVDGFLQGMPEGFPRAENTETQGTVFVFRFPRFVDFVEYDPIIGFHEALIVVNETAPTTSSPVATEAPVTAPTILVPATSAPSMEKSKETPTQENNDDVKSEGKDGLSTGAIIGIAIGGFLSMCCCYAGMASLAKKDRAHPAEDNDQVNNNYTRDMFEDEGDEERGEGNANVVFAGSNDGKNTSDVRDDDSEETEQDDEEDDDEDEQESDDDEEEEESDEEESGDEEEESDEEEDDSEEGEEEFDDEDDSEEDESIDE